MVVGAPQFKYRKVKTIGEGAYGKAVLVRNKTSNMQFVIKEVNIFKMGTKERTDARREVAAANRGRCQSDGRHLEPAAPRFAAV